MHNSEEDESEQHLNDCAADLRSSSAVLAPSLSLLPARACNRRTTTTFGGTFSSIPDRYVDCIVLLGLGIAGVNWIYVGAALMDPLLVSYVRANGEGNGFQCTAGIAERREQLIIPAIGPPIRLAASTVLLVAILPQFTAL